MLTRLKRVFAARAESGSVAIAMIVIMVLTGLATAGLARTLSSMKSARTSQNFAANLSWADSAISDVLYRLDQEDYGDPTTHVLTRTTSEYKYTATPVETYATPDHYTVLAKGTGAGTNPHGVKVTLRRRARFGYGLYSVTDLDLSGGAPATVKGWTEADGTYTPAIIGSGGKITIPSNRVSVGGGDGQDYFFPNGQCINCYTTSTYRSPDTQHKSADEAPIVNPITMPSGTTQACNFTGAVAAGVYLCSGDATFTGNTTILQTGTGVQIYIPAGKSIYLNQKMINYTGSSCGASAIAGDASLLRVFMVGGTGSSIDIGAGTGTCFSGIIYAPATKFVPQGQGMRFTGSMFVYSVTGNGDPTGFNFYFDRKTNSVTRDWKLEDYLEIPSGQVP